MRDQRLENQRIRENQKIRDYRKLEINTEIDNELKSTRINRIK